MTNVSLDLQNLWFIAQDLLIIFIIIVVIVVIKINLTQSKVTS